MFRKILGKSEKQAPKNHSESRPQYSPRSREGSIIRAIITLGRPVTWSEIQDVTGLEMKPLNRALFNLIETRIIYKIKEGIEDGIVYNRYQIFDELQPLYSEIYNPKAVISRWIGQWKAVKKLDFSEEKEHFFLERRYLDDFSKDLICHALYEVFVANPFIQDCDLSNTLIDAKRNGITVRIITRPPEDKYIEYLEKHREYHSKLRKEGIAVFYDPKVHAKLIMVDRAIAIVSSMNFYAQSSAGVSWEAGLVSMNNKVVESITSAFLKALADADSAIKKVP